MIALGCKQRGPLFLRPQHPTAGAQRSGKKVKAQKVRKKNPLLWDETKKMQKCSASMPVATQRANHHDPQKAKKHTFLIRQYNRTCTFSRQVHAFASATGKRARYSDDEKNKQVSHFQKKYKTSHWGNCKNDFFQGSISDRI